MLAVVRRLRNKSASRFILVGCVAASIDFTTFNLVLPLVGASRIGAVLANTTSFALATCVGFALNSRFTFGSERTRDAFVRYIAVALVGVVIYDLGLFILLAWTPPGDVLLTNVAKAVAVGPSATWNYLGFRHFVFRAALPAMPVPAGAAAEAGDGRR